MKKNEYKKAINILLELIEKKRDQIFDNKDNDIYKKHLESLRVSIEIIEEEAINCDILSQDKIDN